MERPRNRQEPEEPEETGQINAVWHPGWGPGTEEGQKSGNAGRIQTESFKAKRGLPFATRSAPAQAWRRKLLNKLMGSILPFWHNKHFTVKSPGLKIFHTCLSAWIMEEASLNFKMQFSLQ